MATELAAPPAPFSAANGDAYAAHVNPQWSRLLEVMGMKVAYTRCRGVELHTRDGRRLLDFLSGYCVHNTGHNHPAIIAALKEELDREGPAMLQSHVPELAGELAERLCRLAGGGLNKVFFCSSGSEGVEASIKFARGRTRRSGLLSASGAFHGLTCGALSLMDDPFWAGGFGPLLPGTQQIPFNDPTALARALATRQFAAFIVEPVQGEAGIVLPAPGYLAEAQALCRRYGTLFVLDEVQTGMFRTGPFLAGRHDSLKPDMVILAKALSGGLVPIGAVLMTDEIYDAVYSSLKRSIIHTSTFSENGLAMRAGMATLDVLEQEHLGENAAVLGDSFRATLRRKLSGYDMVKEVRGIGMLTGIEFQAPSRIAMRVQFEAFRQIHPALFGQALVRRLFREGGMLAQICGNNFMVLKAVPPLVVDASQLEAFASALEETVAWVHASGSFWSEALSIARSALRG
jgi:ornithine--oxo-acid transaminase